MQNAITKTTEGSAVRELEIRPLAERQAADRQATADVDSDGVVDDTISCASLYREIAGRKVKDGKAQRLLLEQAQELAELRTLKPILEKDRQDLICELQKYARRFGPKSDAAKFLQERFGIEEKS